jgi:hypothetical protein
MKSQGRIEVLIKKGKFNPLKIGGRGVERQKFVHLHRFLINN